LIEALCAAALRATGAVAYLAWKIGNVRVDLFSA
jgi:hypothetical protein